MDLKRRQYAVFGLFLTAAALLATMGYHQIGKKWVLFRKAEQRFEKKDFQGAVHLYRAAIKSGLQHTGLMMHLGTACLATRRPDEAVAIFETILENDPRNESLVFQLAGLYAQFGRFDDAVGLFRGILAEHPGHRLARIHLARLLSWQGNIDGAIREYYRALGDSK